MAELYRELDKNFKLIEANKQVLEGSEGHEKRGEGHIYDEEQTRNIMKALITIFKINKARLYESASIDQSQLSKTISIVNRIETFLCNILDSHKHVHSAAFSRELVQMLTWFNIVAIKCWEVIQELNNA